MKKVIALAGDGIGPEITEQAIKVIKKIDSSIVIESQLIGGAAYDQYQNPLPENTLAACKNADAVLLGAVGGPKWDNLDSKCDLKVVF